MKKSTYWALVQCGRRTVAVDADGRLDIYTSREAAMSASNREVTDRLVRVRVEIVRAPKRARGAK